MRVEKTLLQTLACQLLSTLTQLLLSYDLKLTCKLSLLNSHQLSCNSCSRLTGTRELRKLFMRTLASQRSLTLMQLLFSFDRDTRAEKKLTCKLSFANSHQLSCKLSLVNSDQLSCNSCSRLTRTRELRKLSCKLLLVNSHQLSCNSVLV